MFVTILAYVLLIAILIRVILSWVSVDPSNPLYAVLHEITEPILAPIRQFMPRMGMIDITPMVATFVLIFLAQAVAQSL